MKAQTDKSLAMAMARVGLTHSESVRTLGAAAVNERGPRLTDLAVGNQGTQLQESSVPARKQRPPALNVTWAVFISDY